MTSKKNSSTSKSLKIKSNSAMKLNTKIKKSKSIEEVKQEEENNQEEETWSNFTNSEMSFLNTAPKPRKESFIETEVYIF